MLGGRSFQLARVFGIRVGADASWFVILFLLIFTFSGQYKSQYPHHDTKAFALAAITAVAFVLSIALHELGHALAARRVRMRVLGIELWAFGGFTHMEREAADTPRAELAIAAAGPGVTFAIAAVSYAIASASVGKASGSLGTSGISPVTAVFGYLALVNGAILVLNLIPGLPLDGGRIARAIVWGRTGDFRRATAVTAQIGRFAGYVVGAAALAMLLTTGFTWVTIWLGWIALVITSSARAINAQARVTAALAGKRVADVMDSEPVVVPATTKLDRVLEDFFLRYRWDWFPVVDVMGHFIGLVSRDRVEAVPEALRPGSSVDEVTASETRSAYRIGIDEPLEALLASDGLRRLGALMVVDASGVLRGVVTVEQVRRALKPPVAAPR